MSVNVTYDGAGRVGALSMDKVKKPNAEGVLVDTFQLWCVYKCTNAGDEVPQIGRKKCLLEAPWADVPANIQNALVTLNNRMQTAINADAGLT